MASTYGREIFSSSDSTCAMRGHDNWTLHSLILHSLPSTVSLLFDD